MSSRSDEISDLSKLQNLDTQTILECLKRRFVEGKIYTYIGDVLLAINPYEVIPDLYTDELLDTYKTTRNPPHIYWTAEQSYKRLLIEHGNQCIIVTGDSGAGKTESTKHLLEYLVRRPPCTVNNLVEKLNRVNPLIELFGNAGTILNRNSSRFGKLIDLAYHTDGSIIGGKLRTFVLEKSRIVHHKVHEKNFHIFHALFAGNHEQDLRDTFHLEKPTEYRIMLEDDPIPHKHNGVFQSQEEKQWYGNSFTTGKRILKEIGFNTEDISKILRILAACLHLGNIEFEEVDETTNAVDIKEDLGIYLRNAVDLLDIDENKIDAVNEALISKPVQVKGQMLQKRLNRIQADDVRDSIIKALYAGVFRAIIDQINTSIDRGNSSSRARQVTIGILDISGFECLEENSLEQLFINITNEQIQQYHQQQVFEIENKEYIEEGIQLPPNSFKDNTDVLNLVFGSPGILSILDDQMKVTSSDNAKLVTEYNHKLRSDIYQSRNEKQFEIIHYAGQVVYCVRGFLEKNRGTISENIKEIFLDESDNYIVNSYFDASDTCLNPMNFQRHTLPRKKAKEIEERYKDTGVLENRPTTRSSTNTAAVQFRKSLTHLKDILAEAKPLFVRCIKSNLIQQSMKFDQTIVLKQLESAGVKDVIRIRQDGFQVRLAFDKFLNMCHIFKEYGHIPEDMNHKKNISTIAHICALDNTSYQVGRTKVFFKGYALEQINCKMKDLIQRKQEMEVLREKERELKRSKELEVKVSDKSSIAKIDSTSPFRPSSNDIEMTNIPAAPLLNLGETESVNSYPPDYSEVENENRRNKNKRWAWDTFRNTEREFEAGCIELESFFLKLCRFFIYFGLIVGILLQGSATVLIPLLKVSQLLANVSSNETDKVDSRQKAKIVTELIICYSVPIAFTFIQSLFKICLGRVKNCELKYFLPVLILESAETCGTAYLLFSVLPHHSTTSALTIIMLSFTFPAVLNVHKHIILAKNRKFSSRLLTLCFAMLAVIIQWGLLICLIVKQDIVLNANEKTPETSFYIVTSLIAVSLGYCRNFLTADICIGPVLLNIQDWRISIDKAQPKINLKICIVKVGIFLCMAKVLVPDAIWTLTNDTTSTASSNVSPLLQFFKNHPLMVIYIYCAICVSYESALACKLHMQRIAFFVPCILIPIACFGAVFGYCYNWSTESVLLGGKVVCPNIDSIKMWLGSSIALWISMLLLTWHVFFPDCHRMERVERLFILPTLGGFFSGFGLLFKRKDDVIEHELLKHAKFKSNEERQNGNAAESEEMIRDNKKDTTKKKQKARPYVYICGTMWHETRIEMLQLLKSLFRLDFYRSKFRIAESYFKADVDYFEHEIHIIFDDAFETDKKSKQRLPNDYVRQLVECIEEASTCVAKGHLKWDKQPAKTTTPYGGRLSWVMPGGTNMVFHLKDKDKIRHRKRWSQIFYMYYLLGYKMFGAELEDMLLETEYNKRYHYRRTTSILNQLPKDKIKRAHNSFILALDGDVDFKPEAVQKLIDKMTKNDKVGAVCGRIHPIGSGPVVWYQQFEYAVGHWLQKAAEHVFGCVLCCPGCFSLFRGTALMDDNVIRMYTSPPTEARHFIQFEQGEDRWLCTLLLQQGWKIDYCASADAFTYAPQTFKEFFIQRRRWAPSTLANIIDLLSSWRVTTKVNDNISTLFILYQFVLLITSMLGIGTVTLMITGSFNAVLKITMMQSYVVALIPTALYAIICVKCNNDKQITAAALFSTIYTLVMVIVTVGLFVNIAVEKPYSPNVIFFAQILFIFVCSGIAHPKEIMCLVNGLIYYLMVPSTFIFLTVYYMCNIHVVSWGTREKKPDDDAEETKTEAMNSKTEKIPIMLRCCKALGILSLVNETTKVLRRLTGVRIETENINVEEASANLPVTEIRPPSVNPPRRHPVRKDPNAWHAMQYLGTKQPTIISDDETEFWHDILDKYLHPIKEDKQKKEEIEKELISLRNNVAFGFLLLNFLFATAIFQLQNNEDQLKKLYILNEYEPLSVAFLLVFAIVILIQFIGMLVHRWGTFLHLISSVRLWSVSKATHEQWSKQALKESEKLQSADIEADFEETVSLLSHDSRVYKDTQRSEITPDYPVEEPDEDYPLENITPHNEYERNFHRRFQTIRNNFKQSKNRFGNNRVDYRNNRSGRNVNRFNLYRKTFGRHAGSRINHALNANDM